jgi:hypothetical protein
MNLVDHDLDTLGRFLACRDVAELTRPVDLLVPLRLIATSNDGARRLRSGLW